MLIVKTTKNKAWNANLRVRVGQSVIYAGSTWVNKTGFNSEPGVSTDWEEVSGGASYIVPFGELTVYKLSTNSDLENIEAGDIATGQLNTGIFLERGVYVSGSILDAASYSSTKIFDPNS